MDGWSYRRVNGNLRTMRKSHEMIRLEIPNRIAQANVQAFKVLVIILARKVKVFPTRVGVNRCSGLD